MGCYNYTLTCVTKVKISKNTIIQACHRINLAFKLRHPTRTSTWVRTRDSDAVIALRPLISSHRHCTSGRRSGGRRDGGECCGGGGCYQMGWDLDGLHWRVGQLLRGTIHACIRTGPLHKYFSAEWLVVAVCYCRNQYATSA